MICTFCSVVDDPNDQEYMIWLYNEFHRLMFATAKKHTANPSDWEDIVQDSLVNLMKKISLLRAFERCTLSAYIVSTVRNVSFNHLKKHGNHVRLRDKAQNNALADVPYADDLVHMIYQKDRLSFIWDNLPEEEQLLLKGKYSWGYADEELAAVLNCKPDSIRMKLTRARRHALNLMEQLEEEQGNEQT